MAKSRQLFACLNIEHPLVAWEVAIGRVQSVGEINDSGFSVSLWAYSRLQGFALLGCGLVGWGRATASIWYRIE